MEGRYANVIRILDRNANFLITIQRDKYKYQRSIVGNLKL